MSGIERVGVVGAGQMGAGIAEVCARAGNDVHVVEQHHGALDRGRERILASMDRAVDRGRLSVPDRDAAASRLTFSTDLGDLADRQLVIEAVVENEMVKCDLAASLDKVLADPDAVIASNTSSIPIMKLAHGTGRPGQVVGLHFFNPVPVLPLVEVVGSLTTSAQTLARVEEWVTGALGKQTIRAADRAGFVVNALLVPYLLGAVRMVETGRATPADVDAGMRLGCAHPMGPLELADLIGLDTVAAIAETMYAEEHEPLYAPPPLLRRMVQAGLLGRKTGRGFHSYPATTAGAR
ncbi:3-hydroxybutyryl-CoA dehydrogenase, 3-hydroxyacyl-CoA dehydrogenase [Pseudonocardia sp. Ae406_Ps2]|uniref:3-hydroxybutyryl-CoA dehydrogenase n=1 Tax=unclassified Pseudonocardia TaxID=2619320 RepID=UPI00030D20B7|nr:MULTISPECIES: 3-hydroxybutyryl-CoA dehydrogenase [unclassified Pseudonocardia]OLL96955.1 3-hydroxybutyryl-CoA dehydrogenase, 3-hydroxyacyl-CoA dehydrogenase [Pseudonocardia sp. Ae331_Ps2]OLM05333.1 3-hydroxybutyryl-CoA dehydrogenase, 3-hydroxyacyl-CoA dehydrogenase [Pseudonocardia sp. Ae406_Ps2]OLM26905.1 3-hydroxybutyryl-CoA dehydrogenase, 3-hydroxyacyl-CoA dehydrogenase [Pseudonocardia sp. Ae706_Ps2]OLM32973.1 3-hydroxybutyryl-CoA dehydrogenase, 3-hydroxyacyl-CoA dehydrogenase [Pseudonocar